MLVGWAVSASVGPGAHACALRVPEPLLQFRHQAVAAFERLDSAAGAVAEPGRGPVATSRQTDRHSRTQS